MCVVDMSIFIFMCGVIADDRALLLSNFIDNQMQMGFFGNSSTALSRKCLFLLFGHTTLLSEQKYLCTYIGNQKCPVLKRKTVRPANSQHNVYRMCIIGMFMTKCYSSP